MQSIQLYIEGQRVELFKDESVTTIDTIKNVNDVSKVFTEYSRAFSLPASKEANKIFKHFYNSDIQNGYDARIQVPAKIELNNLPFKEGYIKLEGTSLKNNKAHTYKVRFFGNTISLKNLIGDDVLTNLSWLANFNSYDNGNPIIYNAATVFDFARNKKNRTVGGVNYITPLQIPLLTHTQRLYYDSNENLGDTGNLHWQSGSTNEHGVRWDELKFALKLSVIIKAIEEQYGITFSTDFFNTNNDEIKDLYMWLHRTKGGISNEKYVKQVNTFPSDLGIYYRMINNVLTLETPARWVSFEPLRIYVRPATGYENIPYDVVVYYNGNVHWEAKNITGDVNGAQMDAHAGGGYTVEISSLDAINFDNIIFENRVVYAISYLTFNSLETITSSSFQVNPYSEYNILQQIPKMKVLDFLTSLFKMFNLVAYLEDDIIVVKKLEEFYSQGTTYDITKYIDVNKSQVNSSLPFREIQYSYKGLKTFLSANHEQLFNKPWGTEEFSNNDTTRYSGGIFKQEIPFEHMKFERLVDAYTSEKTTIQWGWCADDNQESFLGLPIIFHIRHKDYNLDDSISFVNSIDGSGSFIGHQQLTKHFQPQNTNIQSNTGNYKSLNFKKELDEFSGEIAHNSLFNTGHVSYMASVFNLSNRITKVTAYLPLRVLLNYNLSDRFIISDKSYKINSIKTNLQNGKSELELLNDYKQQLNANYNITDDAYFLGDPDGNFLIFIDWTRFYGAASYNVSINGTIQNYASTHSNPTALSFYQNQGISTLVIFIKALDSSGNVLQTSNTLTVQI